MNSTLLLRAVVLFFLLLQTEGQDGDGGLKEEGRRQGTAATSAAHSEPHDRVQEKAAVGSKYHRNAESSEQLTDSSLASSLMRFSFLQPPKSEPILFAEDSHHPLWRATAERHWNNQPSYETRPPDINAAQVPQRIQNPYFEVRPSAVNYNPYVREPWSPASQEPHNYPSGSAYRNTFNESQHYGNENRHHEHPAFSAVHNGPSGVAELPRESFTSQGNSDRSSVIASTADRAVPSSDSTNKNSMKSVNLAALLAGAGTISSTKPDAKTGHKRNHEQLWNHSGHAGSPIHGSDAPDSEYYDELYDEFIHMYYDPESADGSNKSKGKKRLAGAQTATTDGPKFLPPETAVEEVTTTTANTATTTATTTSFTAKTTTAEMTTLPNTSTIKSLESTKDSREIPPVSLSEVLQEMGMNLPQLLVALQLHGSSLKEFTLKLHRKRLSKDEFRRAKGDAKMLFDILDESPDKNSRAYQNSSPVQQHSEVTPKTTTDSETSVSQSTTSSDITGTSDLPREDSSVAITSQSVEQTISPLIFGSRPGGIGFTRGYTNNNRKNDEEGKSPAVAVKLDIVTLMKEKEASQTDILQNFKSMFNVTDISELENREASETMATAKVKETTAKPRLTTVPLRLYRKEPQTPRPYRPVGYEQHYWSRNREVIGNRLSSTARPTLRPPYMPRPPSENGSFEEEKPRQFESAIIVDKLKPENEDKEVDKETIKKRNGNESQHFSVRNNDPESLGVATRSAIMAAGILGGVALTVFIAIFVVVKHRSHLHRHKRRAPLALPSESSSSSLHPIYASRSCISKESYRTSGFWNTLKKRFDPYTLSASPISIKDSYIYSEK